jgi:hypothetical protein
VCPGERVGAVGDEDGGAWHWHWRKNLIISAGKDSHFLIQP